jgi:hypothetical protein
VEDVAADEAEVTVDGCGGVGVLEEGDGH